MINNIFLITWVTHNSRYNYKTIKYSSNINNAVILDANEQEIVKKAIIEKIQGKNIKTLALCILKDHVHIIIQINQEEIIETIRILKGYSSYILNKQLKYSQKGKGKQNKLWGKHYNISYIRNTKQLENSIKYVQNNKAKHEKETNHSP